MDIQDKITLKKARMATNQDLTAEEKVEMKKDIV